MVNVCDAIMGSGKTQSIITYINEHPDQRYVYISPYLEEANRISKACPDLNFVQPEKKYIFKNSKVEHTHYLIKKGMNIATTHQAFKNYKPDMLEDINNSGYTLVIDENINMLETLDIHKDDIKAAIDLGFVTDNGTEYNLNESEYHGNIFKGMFNFMSTRKIVHLEYDNEDSEINKEFLYYWILSPELITSFEKVFILTYLFEGQGLYNMLKMNHIPFRYIGIKKTNTGNGYAFSNNIDYIPEYVKDIKNMIDVINIEKLNKIGDSQTALSKSWFSKQSVESLEQLKNHIYNVFQKVWKNSKSNDRMWSTYISYKGDLTAKGHTKSFTPLNLRSSNTFSDRHYLVYACNIYMNVGEKLFYKKYNIEVDEDKYALSVMLQWIWRSAIRNGEKIHIYLPSRRMRNLLTEWMDSISG